MVTITMNHTSLYSVSSGVEAISFPMLYDDGATFALQSPVHIAASRLVSSGTAPCRVLVGGVPHIYFSTSNQSSAALSVPLIFPGINSIYSVTGAAAPPELFAPGVGGFVVPESHFANSSGLVGEWRFLGTTTALSLSPERCSSEGVGGECVKLSEEILSNLFAYTQAVINKLIRQSNTAAQRGQWAPVKGKFRLPFLKNAARALMTMRQQSNTPDRSLFLCEQEQMMNACQRVVVRKEESRAAFDKVFSGSWPKGLRKIQRQRTKEGANFRRELAKLPDSYVSCPMDR